MRRFVVAAALCLSLAAYVQAQTPGGRSPANVVLLRDGRLLKGKVTQQGNRYRVEKAYGTIELTGDQVLGVFADSRKAYEFQRSQLSGAEAAEYVRLAFWCLRYKLFDEARDCVREAMSIEPSNKRLRHLLDQIDQQERLAKRRLSEHSGIGLKPAAYAITSGVAASRPIPQQAVELFARRIQPMISRRCAAASCHGPRSKTSFALWPSMYPAPAVTNYNIRQLAHYVDWQNPEKSPLLIKAIVPHGGAITPPLPRRQNDPAFETLYEWVKVLVENDPLATKDEADGEDETRPTRLLPAPSSPPTGTSEDTATEEGSQSPSVNRNRRESSQTAQPQATAPANGDSKDEQIDPFDPEEFNRRFYDPQANQGGAGGTH